MKKYNSYVVGDYIRFELNGKIFRGKIKKILDDGRLCGTWGEEIANPEEIEVVKLLLAGLY